MLESLLHGDNSFITLTYDDEHLPKDGSLDPKHITNFLKKLRKRLSPIKVRYYLCGEYGDQTFRPHYHIILFGYRSCAWGITRKDRTRKSCCASCDLIAETWGNGHVMLGQVSDNSAQYCAGYVVKKMTDAGHPKLKGRHPEYARMSNRPGLGLHAMDEVSSAMLMLNLDNQIEDVPQTLRHGKKQLPIGRYLRKRLRKLIGRDEKVPENIQKALVEEMRLVRAASFNSSPFKSVQTLLKELDQGAVARLYGNEKLKRKKQL